MTGCVYAQRQQKGRGGSIIRITEKGDSLYPYKRIKKQNKDEHRIIMNIKDSNLVVHHIDGNPKNNNKNNLRIMSRSEHSKFHRKKQKNRPRKHPSLSAYNDRGCRCEECKRLKHERYLVWKKNKKKAS